MTIPMIQLSNGVQMPQEGFGVFQIPETDCEQVVRDAIASGYRLIDTASSYQNEAAVGRAIAGCGVPREELFITTKAYIHEMGYENTMQAFNRSLMALGLDHLDLYLIHMPFGDYYGSWRALEDLYDAGKVRAIGVCNFLPDRLLDLCMNARIRPMVDQIERHPHYQRADELALMRTLGVQPQAWAHSPKDCTACLTSRCSWRLRASMAKRRRRSFCAGMWSKASSSFQNRYTEIAWKKISPSGISRWTLTTPARSPRWIKTSHPCSTRAMSPRSAVSTIF